ncbi:MAG: hypothetical protein IJV73_05500 [Clostridia bacterium]|nr:hypothetical protein [Clostridia bacterium]
MNEYQAILNKEYQGRLWVILCLILFVIFMIVFSIVITRKISHKKERIVTFIVLAFIIFASICIVWTIASQAVAIKKDIDDNAFVVYHGKYKLRQERNSHYCYIYDGEEYLMLSDLTCGMTDEYEGYVVYGKNSLYVVDIYE